MAACTSATYTRRWPLQIAHGWHTKWLVVTSRGPCRCPGIGGLRGRPDARWSRAHLASPLALPAEVGRIVDGQDGHGQLGAGSLVRAGGACDRDDMGRLHRRARRLGVLSLWANPVTRVRSGVSSRMSSNAVGRSRPRFTPVVGRVGLGRHRRASLGVRRVRRRAPRSFLGRRTGLPRVVALRGTGA
jgi:hypothetical protein